MEAEDTSPVATTMVAVAERGPSFSPVIGALAVRRPLPDIPGMSLLFRDPESYSEKVIAERLLVSGAYTKSGDKVFKLSVVPPHGLPGAPAALVLRAPPVYTGQLELLRQTPAKKSLPKDDKPGGRPVRCVKFQLRGEERVAANCKALLAMFTNVAAAAITVAGPAVNNQRRLTSEQVQKLTEGALAQLFSTDDGFPTMTLWLDLDEHEEPRAPFDRPAPANNGLPARLVPVNRADIQDGVLMAAIFVVENVSFTVTAGARGTMEPTKATLRVVPQHFIVYPSKTSTPPPRPLYDVFPSGDQDAVDDYTEPFALSSPLSMD